MIIKDIIGLLNDWAKPTLQESYDNSGLIVGDSNKEFTGALICLDSTEAIVDEAIELGYNLIIAHHPIVFSGIKKLVPKTYVEKTVIKAIKHDIAIYAIHTNLDNIEQGVSFEMAKRLGLENLRILKPKSGYIYKLSTYVPQADAEKVKSALFEAGAGMLGKYKECSFSVSGEGSFFPMEGSNPHLGVHGTRHLESEIMVEVILEEWNISKVISSLKEAHPYEEVPYNVLRTENYHQGVGSGVIGEFHDAIDVDSLLTKVKSVFGGTVRYTHPPKQKIKSLALCGGSGSFLLSEAVSQQADCFLSSDFKYHQFFDALEYLILLDIGHYEGEQFTMNLIHDYLNKKIPNFAAQLTVNTTNPIHYF